MSQLYELGYEILLSRQCKDAWGLSQETSADVQASQYDLPAHVQGLFLHKRKDR